jgi:hypothetical protein
MNLAVLRKTRRRPDVGDVFVMQPPDGAFLFGRVIDTSAEIGPMKSCILIYVYRTRAQEKAAPAELLPDDLLVPPMITNGRPWTMGYFEPIENRALRAVDSFPQHCFADPLRGWYFDERGRRLPAPIEPVGTWGLHSFRTIDDAISTALGIPLSPDT